MIRGPNVKPGEIGQPITTNALIQKMNFNWH